MVRKKTISRLIALRLPLDLEKAIKAVARTRNQPWQTVLKALLAEKLELHPANVLKQAEVKKISARGLQAAARKLKG